MTLQIKPVATKFAVITFFLLGIIGALNGLSPLVCCKRALIGAFIAYVILSIAVKIINAILINANKITEFEEEQGSKK